MAKVHLAFRFHINFYHSYRGDKPDETGFGKDMRIIRYILDTLDRQNAAGVNVKGTWDSENYFTLEKLMPKYCPDILERLRLRVNSGKDEMEIMSYNNGLVSAHTQEEFDIMMKKTLSNEQGSGLKDLFSRHAPVVRSQECMMTPILASLYKKYGVEAITMFYSCIPFNGFSNFTPLLPVERRFNPIWYRPEGRDDRIIIIPAVGVADVFDNLGIRAYLKHLRKYQLKMDKPEDFLVLVDMDADDDYWRGYFNTYLFSAIFKDKEKLLWRGGLNHMINQVKNLDFVEFDTPYNYLLNHPPQGEVSFGEDTADGSFDSLSPWADKLDNSKLWSGIERARTLCEYARAVSQDEQIEEDIKKAAEDRILTLSTTHFGLSTPVMCLPRLQAAGEMVKKCLIHSQAVLDKAQKDIKEENKIKVFFTDKYYQDDIKRGFIRMRIDQKLKDKNFAVKCQGRILPSFVIDTFDGCELRAFVCTDQKELELEITQGEEKPAQYQDIQITQSGIGNKDIILNAREGQLEIYYKGGLFTDKGNMDFWVEYDNRILKSAFSQIQTSYLGGGAAMLARKGEIPLFDGYAVKYEQRFIIIQDLPYIFAEVQAHYPKTPDYKADKRKVKNLKRKWDSRWRQIAPLEIAPAFRGEEKKPIEIIKHNFFGDISSYKLDYGYFSENKELDAIKNAITASWVAARGREGGILLAQSVTSDNNFAFAGMRLRKDGQKDKLTLNPFGTYFGRQLHYPTRRHELVGKVAVKMAAQYSPLAPSFAGERQRFSLMIAPFEGILTTDIVNDAVMHSYPPHIVSGVEGIEDLGLGNWELEK